MKSKQNKPIHGISINASLVDGDIKSLFDELFRILKDLLLATGGDINESIQWIHELDRKFQFTTPNYGMADFLRELESQGYIRTDHRNLKKSSKLSSKMELALRKGAFEELFGNILKAKPGRHNTNKQGKGDEWSGDLKPYQFGDNLERINAQESIKNAMMNPYNDQFSLTENDLFIQQSFDQSQTSTVLMIDISHSMILYGEDRITPAKKVGLALAQMLIQFYPKDTLDILVFGDDAWKIELKDLPYLQVGPYHTNTVAGLELAINLLNKRKNPNKKIMMITDGKPTCIKKGNEYYKNSFGLDRQILNRTLALATKCRKLGIDITTFMVATDPFLIEFVEAFSKANQGKAFYTALDGLGEQILINYRDEKKQ